MTALRTVLLTGASSGIGAAIRDQLLRQGHQVVGVSRQPACADAPDNYHPVACDLSQLDRIEERLKSIVSKHTDINTAILNAGTPIFGHLEQLSLAQIRAAIDLNLTSQLLVARAVVPNLKQQGRGDIIFIGSESALRGGRRGSIYCAAKFGLRGFALSLREECSPAGVRVTMIHPGMTHTPFFDQLDFAPGKDPANAIDPDDIAAAVNLVLEARPETVFDEIELSPLKKVIDFHSSNRQSP